MSNQGIKSYGSYYQTSLNDGSLACVNLSKTYDNVHLVIPIYKSKYKLSPINISMIYTSSNSSVDYHLKTGFKLSIIKELTFSSNKYIITNPDLSVEEYIYSTDNNRYENTTIPSYMIINNNQKKVVYKDSVYTFNSSNQLIKIEDRHNSVNKIYIDYEQGHLESISNDYGEFLMFIQSTNHLRIEVSKNNSSIYDIVMSYDNDGYINEVSYYVYKNGDDHLYNQIQLAFDIYKEIYNVISKQRVRIKHPSTNIYKVLEGRTSDEELLDETEVKFIDNYQTTVKYNNQSTNYFFNGNGLINHSIDLNKCISGSVFDVNNNLIFKSNSFKNNYLYQDEIHNLINDGFCEAANPPWTYFGASITYVNNDSRYLNVTSPKVLKIKNTSSTISSTSQVINVVGTPLDSYTFRCLTKCNTAGNASTIKISLLKNGSTVKEISAYTLSNETTFKDFCVIDINSDVSFDQIKVLLSIRGLGAEYTFDSICLTKQIAGSFYEYDGNNDLLSMHVGKEQTKFLVDKNHNTTSKTGKYSVAYYDYSYIASRDDDLIVDDLELSQSGLYGKRVAYDYTSDNIIRKEEIISHEYDNTIGLDRKILLTKEVTFDNSGEFITQKKIEDNEINYTSDGTKHYLVKRVNLPNGTRYHYKYNNINDLTGVAINDSNTIPSSNDNSINYNSTNLEVDNYLDKRSNKIKYIYNNENRLSSVRLIDSNDYKSLINLKYVNEDSIYDRHLDLIESKEYGDSGDKYLFEYDAKHNLSQVKFKASGASVFNNKYAFVYDNYNRLKEVNDIDNSNDVILSYDNEDRVNYINDDYIKSKVLHNEDGGIDYINNQCINNYKVNQAFSHFLSSKAVSPEQFYNLVRTIHLYNNIYPIYSCFFDQENKNLTYMDSEGKLISGIEASESSISNRYIKLVPQVRFGSGDNRFYYDITSKGINAFSIYARVESSGIIGTLQSSNGANYYIYYNGANSRLEGRIENNILFYTSISLDANKAYCFSLVLEDSSLNLIVNDIKLTYNATSQTFTKLYIGAKSTSISVGATMSVYGIIAYKAVSSQFVKYLSYKGLSYLFNGITTPGNKVTNGASCTSILDNALLDSLTVFPLFNNLDAINDGSGEFSLIDYKKNEEDVFDSDFIYNKYTNRSNLYLKNNKVIYQTTLGNSGTILCNFTLNDNELISNQKTLFSLQSGANELCVCVYGNAIRIYIGDTLKASLQSVSNINNKYGFTYNISNGYFYYRSILNGLSIGGSFSTNINLSNIKLQLGNNDNLDWPLDGFMEMLCISDIYSDSDDIDNYLLYLNKSKVNNKYDDLDRLVYQETMHNDFKIASNEYSYQKSIDSSTHMFNGTSKVSSEDITRLNLTYTYDYEYDGLNRITKIYENNTLIREYSYNIYGYLTKEDRYSGNNHYEAIYTYDNSGNITSKVNKHNNTIVSSISYTYGDGINKNALEQINDNNVITDITYDANMSSNPIQITTNNSSISLTYEGMKLKSYGNISYGYDYLGRRVTKSTPLKTYNYMYDIRGNMVAEKITNVSDNTYIVIQYLYDINNSLYGFIYNNQTYYYIKNMLGIIIHIIDSNGNTVVNYDYDVYGDIISISGSMASTINNINHYVYKSYYIDYENNLYYLKTRFYNPSWGRFISSDRIEYLDASIASGLNLHAYCINDPVNNSDPEGTTSEIAKWILFGIGVAGLAVATVFTFGAAGAVASIAAAALVGGLVAGGITLTTQLSKGQFDPGELGISLITGELYGLISGLSGGSASFGAAFGKVALSCGKSVLLSWNNNFDDDTIGNMIRSGAITSAFQSLSIAKPICDIVCTGSDYGEIIGNTATIQAISIVFTSYVDDCVKGFKRMVNKNGLINY